MTTATTIWRRAGEHRVMPWKNGLGETVEIARSPEGEALDGFDWRVSVAPVVADGAFSVFPGIDRTISVIEGAGMTLDVAGRSVALRPGVPFTYDGGLAVHGRLVDGPVRDINVMVRRGRCTCEMILVSGAGSIAAVAATVVAYGLEGAWEVYADDDGRRMGPGHSVTTDASPLTFVPASPRARLAIAVVRPI